MQSAAEIETLMQKFDLMNRVAYFAARYGLFQHRNFPTGFPLALPQSFHPSQMDDSPACLFFLAVYAAA
jgi:hypothetical protein